jgi:hypothetical protein
MTAKEIYEQLVRHLPREERLHLVEMVKEDLYRPESQKKTNAALWSYTASARRYGRASMLRIM